MEKQLLANVKRGLHARHQLWDERSSHWGCEGPIYRFYHQSFKVYHLQHQTKRIIDTLRSLAPDEHTFFREFQEILNAGASRKSFDPSRNAHWSQRTRVFTEAFPMPYSFLKWT